MARASTKGRPTGLGPAGTALWGSITSVFDLEPRELAVLSAACRQADDVALLEDLLLEQGAVVKGSTGQLRLSAVVSELRQGRLALGRLLDQLRLPEEAAVPSSTARGSDGRSRRAKFAADTRWSRTRQREQERLASLGIVEDLPSPSGEYGPRAVRRG